MYAIETRYLPATNTKPSRIKCTFGHFSKAFSYSYDGDAFDSAAQEMLVCMIGHQIEPFKGPIKLHKAYLSSGAVIYVLIEKE